VWLVTSTLTLVLKIENENEKEKKSKVKRKNKIKSTVNDLDTYHPQTDGQTERINQKIGMFLQHYVNYQQDDWTNWLAAAEFQYNDKQHTAMGKTSLEGRPHSEDGYPMSRRPP